MITVKDIRDKAFGVQKHGYHQDEVDDFLDEIADQMEVLIRENRTMIDKLDDMQAELDAAKAEQPARNPVPESQESQETQTVDDSSYFRNLEETLRETLLGAQRRADQTVSEAKALADKTMSEAKAAAEALRGNIDKETETAKAQLDILKGSISEHKSRFVSMLKEQLKSIEDKVDDDEDDKD